MLPEATEQLDAPSEAASNDPAPIDPAVAGAAGNTKNSTAEGDATGPPQVSQVTGSPQVTYPEDSRWGQKQQQASPKTAANMSANNGASETTVASAPPSHAPQVDFPPGVQSKWGRTASVGGQGRNAPYVGAARAEGDDGGRGGSGRGGSSSGGGASNSGGMRPPEPTSARAGALPPPIPPATAINMTEVDTTPDEDMQRMMEKSDEGPGVIVQSVQLVTAFPLSVAWQLAKFILAIANPGAAMRQIHRRRKKRRALAKKARRMIKERLNLDIRRPADSARLSERLAEARSRQSFGEKISWEVSEIVFDDQASVIRAALELIELEEFENAALESGQQDAGGGTNAINSASSGGGGGEEPGETTSKARRSSSSTGWFGRKSSASNGAADSSSEGAIEGPLDDDTGAGDGEASSAQGNGGWLGLLQRPAKLLRSIGNFLETAIEEEDEEGDEDGEWEDVGEVGSDEDEGEEESKRGTDTATDTAPATVPATNTGAVAGSLPVSA
eukprot:CAMPEP_0182564540 /NCGR_PEP_ID=MMETSP1324-20130603/6454_1 /TAXON_ID=236786 /ORGANISM="Florenciella sp., Strain RCC1587" /LENGTH=501 /DNA_ID=CAMNT_0024778025 /DNA_START=283 /DNA_END=1788 /DNA_ORIENTATION=-